MGMLVEASPYIETTGSNKAKVELYNLPFEVKRIANQAGELPVKNYGFWESDNGFADRLNAWKKEEEKVLFEGWVCKDMHHFQEIYNKSKNVIISFEAMSYEVNYHGRKTIVPNLPDTIDDFINDLKRINLSLFWKSEIADIYGIENVTSNKKIIDYYAFIKEQTKNK